jgi:sugar phosphate permease
VGVTPSFSPGRQAAPDRWRIMALLMLGVAFCHFNRISITVAGAERIIPDYGVDPTRMGVVYSAYLLFYTLCMMPGGWFIDRFGPRAALMVVAFGSALVVGLTGLVGWTVTAPMQLVAALFLVRALLGVVSAPIHPGTARMISHWAGPGGQGTCNGLATAAACVGIAATYVLFGMLMDRFGWPGAFLVAASVTAGFALLWTTLSSDYPPARPLASPRDTDAAPLAVAAQARQLLSLLGRRSLLLLTLSYAALGYFQYLFFYWSQYYFETVRQIGKDESRLYSTLLGLAMGVGMVAGGWLTDLSTRRLGPRRGPALVPAAGLLLAGVVLVPGLLSENPLVTLVFFALSMACAGASEGSFWTTAVALGGRLGGTSAAVVNTGGNAGGLLAPVITPLFSKWFGWQAGIGLASVISLIGAVLWVGIDPTQRGRPTSVEKPAP